MTRSTQGSGRPGTRERILAVALRLFAERGYAGTSVRDIADELDLTKAAVHYHFAAKELIVAALLEPFLARLAAVVDSAAGAEPRTLLVRLAEALAEAGPMFDVLMSDPSVAAASAHLHAELEVLAVRTAETLAGPGASPERVLRAHAALGAFAAGTKVAGKQGPPPPAAREAVLRAALAALGD